VIANGTEFYGHALRRGPGRQAGALAVEIAGRVGARQADRLAWWAFRAAVRTILGSRRQPIGSNGEKAQLSPRLSER
jgi:hypothetical protein